MFEHFKETVGEIITLFIILQLFGDTVGEILFLISRVSFLKRQLGKILIFLLSYFSFFKGTV